MSNENRKRARDELTISTYTEEPTVAVGGFFNGFNVPSDADFKIYKNKHSQQYVFHGENEKLEFDGVPEADDESEYALAIYDPSLKSLDLFKAPVFVGSVTSKSHKISKGPKIKQNNVRANIQRNALGEAFGTKKAKKAITDMERNRIDAERLADIQTDIIDAVKTGTVSLPSREELKQTVLDDRPTPACDVDATNVEDIYPIAGIIPNKELQFIRVEAILNAATLEEKLDLLPFKDSKIIKQQLPKITSETPKTKLQLIYYASLLLGFYSKRRISNKIALTNELNNPSEVLIDGLLERFTVSKTGEFGRAKDRGYKVDPHHEDKLLCYILALIMHINNFIIEVSPLAQELSIKPMRLVGLFRALGATVKSASVAEAEAFGIPKAAAASYKVASLKVPFKMPEMTRRGRRN